MTKINTSKTSTPRSRKARPSTPPAAPEAPAKTPIATAKAPTGKLGDVVDLLRRPEGATIEAMAKATGWQAHSVRGAMSGSLKKKHGLNIISETTEAGRVYRIAAEAVA